MRNQLFLVMALLLVAEFAAGATLATCAQGTEGKQYCRSGEMVQCTKSFDPKLNKFRYEWYPVNAAGQVFDVNSSLFGKTAGYTPMACTSSPDIQSRK